MGMKLISQPGRGASVERWESGTRQNAAWGRMGAFWRRMLLVFARRIRGSEGADLTFGHGSELGIGSSQCWAH